jgi:glycosyltransferase involved in cell wall biosynthesis
MRILLIAGMYPPAMCGVGDYTVHLAQALAVHQHASIGLLTHKSINPLDSTVSPVYFDGEWSWRSLRSVWRSLRQWKPDVVHMQYPSLGYRRSLAPILLAFMVWLSQARLVVTLHEPLKWLSLPWFVAFAFCSQAVIYVRHNYLSLLPAPQAWYLQRKLHRLILNASPLPTSTLSVEQRAVLRNTLVKEKKRLLVFFGFIFPQKGIELLLEVIDPATDQLVLVGASPDADFNTQLLEKIQTRKLLANVTMTGVLAAEQAADVLACADAVVLPFLLGAGSWNTTVHAAMAQGTVVITTTLDTTPEHQPEKNLFFAKIQDAEAMRKLLALHAGKKVHPISPQMEWELIAQEHLKVYSQLGGSHV